MVIFAAKSHSFVFSILLTALCCTTSSAQAQGKGFLRKQMNGDKMLAVEIFDGKGNAIKRFEMGNSDFQRGDQKYRRLIKALEAEQDGSVVVVDTTIDLEQRNPYHIIRSSTTKIFWFDSNGNSRCEVAGGERAGAVAVSKNGQRIAVLHAGFDPFEFERMNEGAANNDIGSLRSDPELTTNRLEIFNTKCQRTWSSTGGISDFRNVTFSPNGKWLLYRVHHQPGEREDRTNRKFEVIDTDKNTKFDFLSNKTPPNIADDGAVELLEHAGKGSGSRTLTSKDGKTYSVQKKRFKIRTWRPGQTGFRDSGEYREE